MVCLKHGNQKDFLSCPQCGEEIKQRYMNPKTPLETAKALLEEHAMILYTILSPNMKGHGGNIGLQTEHAIAKEIREAKTQKDKRFIGLIELAKSEVGEHHHTETEHKGCGACIDMEINQRLDNLAEAYRKAKPDES